MLIFLCIKILILINHNIAAYAIEARKYSAVYGLHLQHMTNYIDDSVNACDDFFVHACGNYDNNGELVPPFLYNQEDRMRFFEEHKHQFGTKVGILLRNLYLSCKARYEINVFTPTPHKTQWLLMLEQIDCLRERQVAYSQYPFLQHEWEILQPQYNLSWLNLAAVLASNGLPTLINIFFAEQAAFVSPAANINTCPTQYKFVEILLPFLKASKRNLQIAHIIGNELWQFCQELSGEVELTLDNQPEPEQEEYDILSTKLAMEYFDAYFAHLNFTDAELAAAYKMPLHVERLKRILTILQMTEPRIILNYILWQTYEQLRFDDCYQLTQEFEHLLLTEYWSWHVFEAYFSRHVALAHYMFQTTRFQQMRKSKLLSENWLQYLVTPPRPKDLNLQLLITNYGHTHLNAERVDANYEHIFAISNNEFYKQLLQMRQVALRSSFNLPLIARDADDNEALYFLRKFIQFSILFIKQPLYHYFATEGFDLWHKANLFYSTDGYLNALDCLLQQQQQHQGMLESEQLEIYSNLSEEQVFDIYRFYNAFKQCQNDYDFWLQAESFAFAEDYVLEYFNLTTHSILYYAVTQLYFGRYDAVYGAIINRSFMNMPHFSQVFNCTHTAMDPIVKCMHVKH